MWMDIKKRNRKSKIKTLIHLGIALILLFSVPFSMAVDFDGQFFYDNDNVSVSGTVLTDLYGNYNGRMISGITTVSRQGLILDARDFNPSGGDSYITNAFDHTSEPQTWSFWVDFDSTHTTDNFMHTGTDSGGNQGLAIRYKHGNTDLEILIDNGAATCTNTVAGVDLTPAGWHHIMILWDGSTRVNGLNVSIDNEVTQLQACANWSGVATIHPTFGALNASGAFVQEIEGSIDEIAYWDRVLENSSIDELWNNSNGLKFSQSVVPVIINSADLYNETREVWPATMRQIQDLFFILVNATTHLGTADGSQQCNYTAANVSHQFFLPGENVSFDGSNTVELTIDHEQENALSDLIAFKVCREDTLDRDIEYYINDNTTVYRTIPGAIIPSCDIGFHDEINLSTQFKTNESLNISVRCSTCNLGQQSRIIKSDIGNLIGVVRNQGLFTDDLDWNVTSSLYEDADTFHGFQKIGENNINITCNQTNYQINKTVIGIVPQAQIDQINIDGTNFNIVNGTNYEAGTKYRFLGGCSGTLIDQQIINLTFANGTKVASNTSELLSVNSSDISSSGIYNLSLFCSNNGNNDTATAYFIINDTTNPTITWTDPLANNASQKILNESFQARLTFNDTNLFAYEVLFWASNGSLAYNFTLLDINTTEVNFVENVNPSLLGTWIVQTTVTDDHTAELIPEYDHSIDLQSREIEFSFPRILRNKRQITENISIKYEGQYDLRSMSTIKEDDRYKFNFSWFLVDDRGINVQHKFRITCPGIIFRQNSDYPAHFVCPHSKKWIDFASEDLLSFTIRNVSKGTYEINLLTKGNENIIFESLGGLNEVTQNVSFQVIEEPTDSLTLLSFKLDSLQNILLLFVFIFAWICLVAMSYFFKNAIIGVIGFLIGIFIGLLLLSFNSWIAIVFILCNVVIMYQVANFEQ